MASALSQPAEGGGIYAVDSSINPSMAGDGLRMVFRSNADLTGQNPDGNGELFAADGWFDQAFLNQGCSLQGASGAPVLTGCGSLAAGCGDFATAVASGAGSGVSLEPPSGHNHHPQTSKSPTSPSTAIHFRLLMGH